MTGTAATAQARARLRRVGVSRDHSGLVLLDSTELAHVLDISVQALATRLHRQRDITDVAYRTVPRPDVVLGTEDMPRYYWTPAAVDRFLDEVGVVQGTSVRRAHADPTVCAHDHAMTPENTYIVPSTGRRECRRCKSDRQLAYLRRKSEAAVADSG